jgi:predicted N-acetyltransferase YhbS
MPQPVSTRLVQPGDLDRISALHARVFGPGRFARTAYRVREGQGLLSPFCRVAFEGDRLVAALRFTEIAIGGREGALLLGPLAVDPESAGKGYGRRLVAEGAADAKARGQRLVVLIGDLPYYGRFGFAPVAPGQIVFPGPVNPARILALELEPGAAAVYRGPITGAAKRRQAVYHEPALA